MIVKSVAVWVWYWFLVLFYFSVWVPQSLSSAFRIIVPRLSLVRTVASRRAWTTRRMDTNRRSSSNLSSRRRSSPWNFCDIGANLLDERFTHGDYHGKHRHEPDWSEMLERAQTAGVRAIIVTAGTLRESQRALELVRTLRQQYNHHHHPTTTIPIQFGCTIGVHPTRCSQEFVESSDLSADEVLVQLKELALDGLADRSVVSLGEIGLDYDRLEFCDKETQQIYLEQQLQIFTDPQLDELPLFLHNRNVGDDLLQVLQRDTKRRCHGVVHSFDDTLELAHRFMDMGLYIGLNGCSLKTPENLQVVKALPLDKILLETDCPYCEIKATHAGFEAIQTKWEKKADKNFELGKMVKGRNEPCQIVQVAEVIAHVKGIHLQEVTDACYENSCKLYGWTR